MTATAPAPRVRPVAPAATRWRIAAVAALVVGAIAFLAYKGLGESTVFFYTADEAVERKDELGDRRFRIEGAVVTDSVRQDGDVVRFEIISAGVVVPIAHEDSPPELFKPGIPVVLEGRWQGETFVSDHLMVKHTSEYREQNPEHVDDYVGKSGDEARTP